ncbi:1-deoxy-D-xylulose-5-phosphate synthase [Anaerotruncus sp. 1XD42-93]|uniref:1-deoxy-D-xylulose-5-phosphate synthase n=1 Tax=Anaerotruncus sp. 1XD42-93 TaxID=2320853 RepID=UPI000EA22CF2|nr:1-deoxy-D-xylulose-5-phosphate synthase [Anaerotruncus sp. 1XD42-93]NBK17212.1 1-deoxy-D-xylulose-5-phosphate synthase [Anaerotruncus sp. 1XD42-93]RKJ97879.1 1-deoxy-D-xylulose-5-phosphate synthase [Anaerotruncus sp. 1XD22-93]
MANFNLLHTLKFPQDLRKLNEEQQKNLCWEIRQRLIRTLSSTGGHLASNLGAVELTVALHTVFDLPQDQIVWDVGHQSYTHKLLTGRLKNFSKIRQEGGISGFPRPSESEYDAFIGGHASTSVSAAYGLAKAKTLTGDRHHVIAVVGDGAFTGGMVYEALNNAGRSGDRLIVVLNDNHMSISESVGSLARYLAEKRTTQGYAQLKDTVEQALLKIPLVGNTARDMIYNSKALLRQTIYHSNMFEDFGFDYLGPVDGHDIPLLVQTFRRAKALEKPVLVHINTIKGKGYPYAEKNPSTFHGVGKFDYESGELKPSSENFSSVFGQELVRLAQEDDRICAITAAMQGGTGLDGFAKQFEPKNRFFDVGIAEEHAVTFACGLAAGGMLPVFAVYSTFLQRGFDQLIHDAAIEQQHVLLAVDRAGLVGDDGETHQGMFDAAFLSQIPGTTVYSPATFADLRYAMQKALYETDGLVAVRYPRGGEPTFSPKLPEEPAEWLHLKYGGETLVISYGREFGEVYRAAQSLAERGKPVDLLKLHRIAPLPEACIALAKRYRTILFVEEGIRSGGIGEHFLSRLSDAGYIGRMTIQAVENPFLPQMSVASALHRCGLDSDTLEEQIAALYF